MELYDKMTDEELIGKLRAGRRDVADYLMEKYKGLVRQKARTMYLIGGETDDLIQEGMIGLFKAVQNYDSRKEASFQTFARLCIDRQLYKAVSGSNRQKHQPLNTYVSLSQEEGTDHLEELWEQSPETIVIARENVDDLETQIRRCLSPLENQVLELYLLGEDYSQISKTLGKTKKSVDNALQRIKGKVRLCVDDIQNRKVREKENLET